VAPAVQWTVATGIALNAQLEALALESVPPHSSEIVSLLDSSTSACRGITDSEKALGVVVLPRP
jgi:hypothetical protein